MACVEYNKALEQSLFNVCSVCINKAWLGCLVWDESTLLQVMHMWCDSLYLFAAFRFSWNCCLLELSTAGNLCMWHPPLSCPAFSHYQQCWILGEQRESSRGHLAFSGLENAELGEVACWEDGVHSFQTRCKAETGALVCEWRLMAARGALFVHCGFIK